MGADSTTVPDGLAETEVGQKRPSADTDGPPENRAWLFLACQVFRLGSRDHLCLSYPNLFLPSDSAKASRQFISGLRLNSAL